MFKVFFNASFLPPGDSPSIKFKKDEVDGAHHDKMHKCFEKYFAVECFFSSDSQGILPSSPFGSPRDGSIPRRSPPLSHSSPPLSHVSPSASDLSKLRNLKPPGDPTL